MKVRKTHFLKTWVEYYQTILDGRKNFELIKNDRDFNEGDILVLQEFDHLSGKFTDREMERKVGYILHGGSFGLEKGFCIMALKQEE